MAAPCRHSGVRGGLKGLPQTRRVRGAPRSVLGLAPWGEAKLGRNHENARTTWLPEGLGPHGGDQPANSCSVASYGTLGLGPAAQGLWLAPVMNVPLVFAVPDTPLRKPLESLKW